MQYNTKEQDFEKGCVNLIREEGEAKELLPDKTEQVKQLNRKMTQAGFRFFQGASGLTQCF